MLDDTMSDAGIASGNAAEWFVDRNVRSGHGDRPAFIDEVRTLTYAALLQESTRFAAGLRAAGIQRERRVALLLHDRVEFPIAFWGAIRAGVLPVPVNTLLPPDQVAYILADSRAEALFVSTSLLAAVQPFLAALPALRVVVTVGEASECGTPWADFLADGAVPPLSVNAGEVAVWLYSSGSTAAPKGVRHVHSSLRATVDSYGAQVLQIAPTDLVYSAAKLFFAYGLGNAMTFPMAVGACSVLFPHRPTADAVLALMRQHRPTIFCGVPTLYAGLLAHPALGAGAGSDRLRRCISAGEALPEHVGVGWRERVGVDILDGIGSTEMLHIFLSNQPGDVRYGTSGRAVPGYDLRIVDAQGADVPDGEPGELLVRGESAADGYWNQRAKSRLTFRGEWCWTGDKYIREASGHYRSCGRSDDMFKVSGIWVSPYEVEGALISHPAVLEAGVVGHADPNGLTKPRAFVVLKRGETVSVEALQAHVKLKAGPWKYPRWIEFLDELPKTATGKIQRFKLRDLA